VAEALETVHAAGYVHGRLTPGDIVQVSGLVKIGGAGLYRDLDVDAARRAWANASRYLAPEVIGPGQATPVSDVYSLAVILA
jgi:serine/threonine protein kinase